MTNTNNSRFVVFKLLRLWILSSLILLFHSYTFSQNEYFGIVLDGATKEPLIGAFIANLNLNDRWLTDFDGLFNFESNEDSIEILVTYTGFPSDIKTVFPGFPPDTIFLKEPEYDGVIIRDFNSPFRTHLFTSHLTQSAILSESVSRIQDYKISRLKKIWNSDPCTIFIPFIRPDLVINNCESLTSVSRKVGKDGRERNRIALYNLKTNQLIHVDSPILYKSMSEGIYEVYLPESNNYWFNFELKDRTNEIIKHINQPVGVIFIQ